MKNYIQRNASFFLLLVLLFSVRWSFADQYRVPTGSMEPTIHIGDHILVNKLAYDFKIPFTDIFIFKTGNPHRGEIVVFKSPEEPGLTLVKRLTAVPGDQVAIQNGFVFINGKPLAQKSADSALAMKSDLAEILYKEINGDSIYNVKRLPQWNRPHYQEFTVPPDQFFFMGDNRDNSHDGRFFGFVPRENLKGTALAVLWNIQFENFLPEMELERIGTPL